MRSKPWGRALVRPQEGSQTEERHCLKEEVGVSQSNYTEAKDVFVAMGGLSQVGCSPHPQQAGGREQSCGSGVVGPAQGRGSPGSSSEALIPFPFWAGRLLCGHSNLCLHFLFFFSVP